MSRKIIVEYDCGGHAAYKGGLCGRTKRRRNTLLYPKTHGVKYRRFLNVTESAGTRLGQGVRSMAAHAGLYGNTSQFKFKKMGIILSKPFSTYGTIDTPTAEKMMFTAVDVFANTVKIKAYRQIWGEEWSTEREMKYTDALAKFESGAFVYFPA